MKLYNSAIESLQNEIFEKQKQLKELSLAQPLEEIREYIFKNKQGRLLVQTIYLKKEMNF
tara:strand:+ start:376 stop:555 length:180 start_codon:yes stop_codon:yes gene_type:complete